MIAMLAGLIGCDHAGPVDPPVRTAAREAAIFEAMQSEQAASEAELFGVKGVSSVGIGEDQTGEPVFVVGVDSACATSAIPTHIGTHRVIYERRPRIRAALGIGPSISPRLPQSPPIRVATSGIGFDLPAYGTLGCLVRRNSTLFLLSASHVLAGDYFNGSDGNVAMRGQNVLQPAATDLAGRFPTVVAHLSEFTDPRTDGADIALAEVVPGMVRADGMQTCWPYYVRSGRVDPTVGVPVRKCGRTTGVTHGLVSRVNVSQVIDYTSLDNTRQGITFRSTIRGLIEIKGLKGKPFVLPGDSGALVITDASVLTPGWPAAMVIASDPTGVIAFAHTMKSIVDRYGVAVVGR